ncbi:hypothetical protein EKO04_006262 [Ascochyta lentis]|uniref:Zn(2)-C6 fungal-type domain-containing protein n=1 Tax=Ascochyta lentis TaxID=205686 RepID=A0A8H7J3Q2_9PLEO|nr:hypothetical protein EKO04_006262 [Ascochyta lentis]
MTRKNKCASCKTAKLACNGGNPCSQCIKRQKKCVSQKLKNAPKETKCVRCGTNQLICTGRPCTYCEKGDKINWCVCPNTDGTDTKYATSRNTLKFYSDPKVCKPCVEYNRSHNGQWRECNGEIPCNHCNTTTRLGHYGAPSKTQHTRCAYDVREGVWLQLTDARRAKNREASPRSGEASGDNSDSYHSSDDEDYYPSSDDDNDESSDEDSDETDFNEDNGSEQDDNNNDTDDNSDSHETQDEEADTEPESHESLTPDEPEYRPQQQNEQRTQYSLILTPQPSKQTTQDSITLRQAMKLPDWLQYFEAMKTEHSQLIENGTWKIVKRPADRKVLSGRWVLRTKDGADGKIEKYKARYVARGFEQVYLLDYDETFATVIKDSSWRAIFALAAMFKWNIYQMDFVTAFLNGEVDEEIYMEQPEGFEEGGKDHVLLLLKALYGLKQAPRQWYDKLTTYLLSSGWTVSEFDPSVYLYPELGLIMGVYVDDVLITGANTDYIHRAQSELTRRFKMKDLGRCKYYLGMHVDWLKDGILVHQRNYIDKIIDRRQLQNLTSTDTPCSVTDLSAITKNKGDASTTLKNAYQAMVGELLYAAMKTRPDISHTVGVLSRYASNPSQSYMDQAIRVYQYLAKTKDTGIFFPYDSQTPLLGYSDSDWATCKDSRKSTSGWIIQLGDLVISHSSKRQRIIAQSTQEAEYVAAAELSNEMVWLQRLLIEILTHIGKKDIDIGQHNTVIKIDNDSARLLSKNPEHHRVAKHFGIRYHVLRQRVKQGVLHLERVASKDNTADLFTKALKREDFERLRDQMGMRSLTDSTSPGGVLFVASDCTVKPQQTGETSLTKK